MNKFKEKISIYLLIYIIYTAHKKRTRNPFFFLSTVILDRNEYHKKYEKLFWSSFKVFLFNVFQHKTNASDFKQGIMTWNRKKSFLPLLFYFHICHSSPVLVWINKFEMFGIHNPFHILFSWNLFTQFFSYFTFLWYTTFFFSNSIS